jgi:hypothetical protein
MTEHEQIEATQVLQAKAIKDLGEKLARLVVENADLRGNLTLAQRATSDTLKRYQERERALDKSLKQARQSLQKYRAYVVLLTGTSAIPKPIVQAKKR